MKQAKTAPTPTVAITDEPPPPPVAEPVSLPPTTTAADEAKIQAALDKLVPEDRTVASAQKYCVILAKSRLGSMGVPIKLMLDGKPIFICCEGCRTKAAADPKGSATKAEELREISEALSKLSPADRKLVEAQRVCIAMEDSPLGSMGVPLKVMVDGQPVFICCEGCRADVLSDTKKTLEKLKQLQSGNTSK